MIENTYSSYFLTKFREQLLVPDKITKEFMNSFFNNLNESTTELFVLFKELKNNYNAQALKKTKQLFQMVIDLSRMLEIITKLAPEIFVDKNYIHS